MLQGLYRKSPGGTQFAVTPGAHWPTLYFRRNEMSDNNKSGDGNIISNRTYNLLAILLSKL
ncbi:MAG TPA: hypothetical protein VEX13_06100, partial [Chloroflexia bacterium]|nr:hypothetical protein [Chloroflexia bacterium]